jgi:16S rRNA (cytosine967-C5)-methyltransferase
MRNEGKVVAVEKHHGRAKALAENATRLEATCVSVREGDALEMEGEFDRVLLDAPCSDLGTLQSRPDVRWKKDENTVARLVPEQERLLDVAAERVRPGGTLVYSTCTISPEENERQADRFLERHIDFVSEDRMQLLPHRDATDGFFIARMRRNG